MKTHTIRIVLNWVKPMHKQNIRYVFLPLHHKGFVLLSSLFLFITSVNSQVITQQKKWVVANKVIDFTNAAANPGTPPTVISTFPTTTTDATNSVTDKQGNILFYTRDAKIYDSRNIQVGTLPTRAPNSFAFSSEISIVPFIEPEGCIKRYYLFYPEYEIWRNTPCVTNLKAKIIQVDLSKVSVSVTDYAPIIATEKQFFLYEDGRWVETHGSCGLAASKVVAGTKRFLYFVSGNMVQKITLTNGNGPNYGISNPDTIFQRSQDYRFDFRTWEVDLSMDGGKLAWGAEYVKAYDGSSNLFFNSVQIFVIGLDPATGDFNGYKLPYLLYNGGGGYSCRGIEFSDDGQHVWFTSGNVFDIWGGRNGNVNILHLNTNPVYHQAISGTEDYNESQLERGPDGMIYAISATHLAAFNPATLTIAYTIPLSSPLFPTNWGGGIHMLPDQIDGEDQRTFYPYTYPYYDNAVNSLGAFLPFEYTSGSTTWNPAAFNGKSVLHVTDGIYLSNPGTSLTIENMTVEFAENAKIDVKNGATLNLINCTLKGQSDLVLCGSGMWQGILASSQNDITIVSSLLGVGQPVFIQDALIGIFATGANTRLEMINMNFKANENHVWLSNGARTFNSANNTFDGSYPLKDQTKGSSNRYTDGAKRTNAAVIITNAKPAVGYNNFYIGGQYGVACNQPLEGYIGNAMFNGQKQSAIEVTNVPALTEVNIGSNVFSSCYNGVTLKGNKTDAQISLYQNQFNSIERFGVDAYDNNGAQVYVGIRPINLNDPTMGNTFTSSGVAAINLSNNANVQKSIIYIKNNTIATNIPTTHGIVISEASLGSRKYNTFRVEGNAITGAGWGITANNIVGGNPQNPQGIFVDQYPTCRIQNNTIEISGAKLDYTGIKSNASSNTSIYYNTISANKPGNRYNVSIKAKDAASSLLWKNNTHTGYGLMPSGDMTWSNYYCNIIERAYTGIMLAGNHRLRTVSDTHGDVNVEARNDFFLARPSGSVDIDIAGSDVTRNYWVFTTSLPNIVNSAQPANTWILAGFGANKCGFDVDSPGREESPVGPFSFEANNPIDEFWAYYHEQNAYVRGDLTQSGPNSNINWLIAAENTIALGNDYPKALGQINNINPGSSAIMADYKTVYQTYLAYKISDTIPRHMNDSSVAILTGIAEKDPVLESPASHSARAILWDERQLLFDRNEHTPQLVLAGWLNGASCGLETLAGIPVYLVDENNQVMEGPVTTNDQGEFAFGTEVVSNYPTPQPFHMQMILPDGRVLNSESLPVEELAMLSDYEFSCALGKKGSSSQSKMGTQANAISVWPNPSNGLVTIKGAGDEAKVTVTNLLGQIVINNVSLLNGILDASTLQSGVYILSITDHQTTYAQKISIIK